MDEIIPMEFDNSDLDIRLISIENIKEYLESTDMNISEDAFYMINEEVKGIIDKALVRAKLNGRESISGKDI